MQRLPGYIDSPLPPAPTSARTRPPLPPLPPLPPGARQPPDKNCSSDNSDWSTIGNVGNPFDLPSPYQPQNQYPSTTPISARPNSGLPPAYEYENNTWVHNSPVRMNGNELHVPQRPRVKSMSEQMQRRNQWNGPSSSTFNTPSMVFPMPHVFQQQVPPVPPLPTQNSYNHTSHSQQPRPPPPPPPAPPRSTSETAVNTVTESMATATLLERATTTAGNSSSYQHRDSNSTNVSRSNSGSAVSLNKRPSPSHGSKSDQGLFNPSLLKLQTRPSIASFKTMSSYTKSPEQFHDVLSSPVESSFSFDQSESKAIASELSDLSQNMEESIDRFQRGELTDAEEEWHRLVPPEALKALDETEIARQSMIFEFFKAERDYVSDLELMESVVIRGLLTANPPVLPQHQVGAFVNDVFGNLHDILVHHKEMLNTLFERQRDDHPLVHSIADIVLETAFKPEFRDAYEKYIKHYPVAESIHQKQHQSNPQYAAFLEKVALDPRIKKRDLKIFLARPVTRLPRLNLLLESMHKRTNKEHQHPDLDTLPLVLGILRDCIKATQPGIEAAESRVKFMDICEHLVPLKGEIMDLDLFDKERHLVYAGPIYIRTKTDKGLGINTEKWSEMQGVLLDNYFIIIREVPVSSTVTKRVVHSKPIPLSFIRLASFNSDPELRKEKSDEGGILDSFRTREVPMYPFTFYHASPSYMKAYNLYASTDALRKKWHAAFVDALGVHKVKQENNPLFFQEQLVDGMFRIPKEAVMSPNTRASGRLGSAVPFMTSRGRFIAVSCAAGIYVARYGTEAFIKIFNFPAPSYIAALQSTNHQLNKLIIHFESKVLAYSLELVAMAATEQGDSKALEASREQVTPSDHNVIFVRHIILGERVLLVYASKKRMSSSCYIHTLEAVATTVQRGKPISFRQYGLTATIPKDAYDVVSLLRTVAVCTRDGLVAADPANFAHNPSLIPTFPENHAGIAVLKSHIEAAKPLGFLRVSGEELMMVYDDLACFVNMRGAPTRNGGYIRWETKATAYAVRHPHLFLISPRFIEIRNVGNGRLLQVIEGGDIRLLYSQPALGPMDNIIVVMRGRHNDPQGLSERIVELKITEEYAVNNVNATSPMWSEWDM